ncbi:MAG: pentapeptide repeat-containing protein [Sandaracinaceae bacterium]|nr:pentapeptide repeat-containing protein [Sandaracinaceae bacterium]
MVNIKAWDSTEEKVYVFYSNTTHGLGRALSEALEHAEGRHLPDLQVEPGNAHGAVLSEAVFVGGHFQGVDFSQSNFDRVRAQLPPSGDPDEGPYFVGCRFEDATFRDADLDGIRFVDCTFIRTDFTGALLVGAQIVGGRWCDIDAPGAVVEEAAVSVTRVATLRGQTWTSCNVQGIEAGLKFEGCTFKGCTFISNHEYSDSTKVTSLLHCRLIECDLAGLDLRDCIVADTELVQCDLEGSSLAAASLTDTVLTECSLGGVLWVDVHLERVRMEKNRWLSMSWLAGIPDEMSAAVVRDVQAFSREMPALIAERRHHEESYMRELEEHQCEDGEELDEYDDEPPSLRQLEGQEVARQVREDLDEFERPIDD